jgi:hypothetical protein
MPLMVELIVGVSGDLAKPIYVSPLHMWQWMLNDLQTTNIERVHPLSQKVQIICQYVIINSLSKA